MADNKEEKTLEQLEEENKMLRRLLAEKENAEIKKALLECEEDDEEDSGDDLDSWQIVQYYEEQRKKDRWRTVGIVLLILFILWIIGQNALAHLNYTITFG
jgi:hypothetical protein